MQLQAGYIFDFVKNKLLSENKSSEVLSLLESLSFFEVDSTLTESNPNDKPELAVLNNLLSRGLPTRPSLFIENIFLNSLAIGKSIPDTLGNIESLTDDSFNSVAQYLFRALHIIDPRVIPDRTRFQIQQSFEFDNIGSRYEEDFLFAHVPRILGAEWFQILESQREFPSIVNRDNNYTRQRTDFSIEFPFHINDKKGIVIEIDGSHHWENQNQIILDEQRDKAVTEAGWQNTLRIKTTSFDRIENQFSILKELARKPYFQNIKLGKHLAYLDNKSISFENKKKN